jgi:hypothetical protein
MEYRDSHLAVVLAPRARFAGGAFEVLWVARVSIRHDSDLALRSLPPALPGFGSQVTAVYSRWNDPANELQAQVLKIGGADVNPAVME